MLELKSEVVINSTVDKVWWVLGKRFHHIADWASLISESGNLGDSIPANPLSGRYCQVRGLGETREVFLYYDEKKLRFAYQALTGLPFFMRHAENHWSLTRLSDVQVMVTSRANLEFTALGRWIFAPLFMSKMSRAGRQTLEELKYFIEQDEAHPRKQQRTRKFPVRQ